MDEQWQTVEVFWEACLKRIIIFQFHHQFKAAYSLSLANGELVGAAWSYVHMVMPNFQIWFELHDFEVVVKYFKWTFVARSYATNIHIVIKTMSERKNYQHFPTKMLFFKHNGQYNCVFYFVWIYIFIHSLLIPFTMVKKWRVTFVSTNLKVPWLTLFNSKLQMSEIDDFIILICVKIISP